MTIPEGEWRAQQFMHDSKLLAVERLGERYNACNIAARSIEACDQTLLYGIGSITENDRDCVGCILGRADRKPAGNGHNYAHPRANQVRGQFRKAERIIIRKAILNR